MPAPIVETAGADPVGWWFEDSYARLPEELFRATEPAPVPAPKVCVVNHRLAGELGLDLSVLSPDGAAALFAGQALPAGCRPIAQAYAGHQYGGFTMLGDGRAILLGEHRTPDGRLVDIQFKGSGRTRFSRGGDGKAALGPMLREYIVSEAMAALGIPTTRSLAVVTTGERVFRETPLRGAILTRVAASHIRVGTFEYAARRGEATLRALADYAIARHDPELAEVPGKGKYLAFYRAVADRQASLIARWQNVGFVHGVMNTDNVAISGETIDYGPCAFMNAYDPATVFSSIDRGGRYAYGNQPGITQWNLTRLGETFLPLLDPDTDTAIGLASGVLDGFAERFEESWLAGMRRKLGLRNAEDGDAALVRSLLDCMRKSGADFTNTFRDLSTDGPSTESLSQDSEFLAWHARWRERLAREDPPVAGALMRSVNPSVIPRNHQVEAALSAAEQHDDLAPLHRLLDVLATPYADRPASDPYRQPPADESGYRTFCGT